MKTLLAEKYNYLLAASYYYYTGTISVTTTAVIKT